MTDERLSQSRVFAYDSVNRLIASTGGPSGAITYALDGVGNRQSVTGGPDPGTYTMDATEPYPADFQMNQYTTTPFDGDPAVARTHDLNGNVTLLPFEDDDLSTTVMATATYDYRNLMVKYERPGMTADYRYDALGRRIGKTVTDDIDSTTTLFFYRGDQVIEERDGGGSVEATYAYGNWIDEVVSMRREGEDVFYQTDDQGTVWALTGNSETVVERYDYSDFGAMEVLDPTGGKISSSEHSNSIQYSGRRWDVESGLYWFRTRYLDSFSGRFTSRDSIGPWGDFSGLGNGMSYVANDPWSWTDPFGLERYGLYGEYPDDPSATHSFRDRAEKGSGKKNTKPFKTGRDILDQLLECNSPNITRADIHSHGFNEGVVGAGSWNGFYVNRQSYHSRDAASIQDFVDLVSSCDIDLAQDAEIYFYGCNSRKMAQILSGLLAFAGRGDVSVTGSSGPVSPNNDESEAFVYTDGCDFRTYKEGQCTAKRPTLPYE